MQNPFNFLRPQNNERQSFEVIKIPGKQGVCIETPRLEAGESLIFGYNPQGKASHHIPFQLLERENKIDLKTISGTVGKITRVDDGYLFTSLTKNNTVIIYDPNKKIVKRVEAGSEDTLHFDLTLVGDYCIMIKSKSPNVTVPYIQFEPAGKGKWVVKAYNSPDLDPYKYSRESINNTRERERLRLQESL